MKREGDGESRETKTSIDQCARWHPQLLRYEMIKCMQRNLDLCEVLCSGAYLQSLYAIGESKLMWRESDAVIRGLVDQ